MDSLGEEESVFKFLRRHLVFALSCPNLLLNHLLKLDIAVIAHKLKIE